VPFFVFFPVAVDRIPAFDSFFPCYFVFFHPLARVVLGGPLGPSLFFFFLYIFLVDSFFF